MVAMRWDRGGPGSIARPGTDQARHGQVRADAVAYLTSAGHADLLPMLGLAGPGSPPGPAPGGDQLLAAGPRRVPVRDDIVDDLVAGRRPAVTVTGAELDAAIDRLDTSRSAREIAERLGTTTRTVVRRRAARRAETGGVS